MLPSPQPNQLTDEQKKMALRAIKIAVVLVPVLGGAAAAWLTGSPFDWGHALQTILPALMGNQ